jgi:hypothetical protein
VVQWGRPVVGRTSFGPVRGGDATGRRCFFGGGGGRGRGARRGPRGDGGRPAIKSPGYGTAPDESGLGRATFPKDETSISNAGDAAGKRRDAFQVACASFREGLSLGRSVRWAGGGFDFWGSWYILRVQDSMKSAWRLDRVPGCGWGSGTARRDWGSLGE